MPHSAVDSDEDNTTVKELMALTSVTPYQSPSYNNDNPTSHYYNLASQRVPIAEVESDFETPDDYDDEDDDDEEEEGEKYSQVNILLVFCCNGFIQFHPFPNISVVCLFRAISHQSAALYRDFLMLRKMKSMKTMMLTSRWTAGVTVCKHTHTHTYS